MIATFWKLSKRVNSTKRPSGSGEDITFSYKDASDMHNPTLLLNTDVSAYNYVKIDDIYFFIESLSTEGKGLWSVTLKIDLLATFKEYIKRTAAMVVYASDYRNPKLSDSRVIALPTYQINKESFFVDNITTTGTYVVRAIGKSLEIQNAYNYGLCPTYLLNEEQLTKFVKGVTADNAWESIQNFFTDAMDGFVDLYWLPFDLISGNQSYVQNIVCAPKVGGAEIDCAAYLVRSSMTSFPIKHKEIIIPWRYDIDDFRNNEPYTALLFYTPWTGVLKLNTSDFFGAEKITIDYCLDIFTGNIDFIIKVRERIVSTVSGNTKVQLPISQYSNGNASGIASGLGTMAGGAATTFGSALTLNPLGVAGGITATLIGGFGAIASASQTEVAAKGTLSGINSALLALANPCELYVVSQDILVDPINNGSTLGYPVGAVRSLDGLSGYVQTSDASVSIPTFQNEITTINNMLNGGVYIE